MRLKQCNEVLTTVRMCFDQEKPDVATKHGRERERQILGDLWLSCQNTHCHAGRLREINEHFDQLRYGYTRMTGPFQHNRPIQRGSLLSSFQANWSPKEDKKESNTSSLPRILSLALDSSKYVQFGKPKFWQSTRSSGVLKEQCSKNISAVSGI